MKPSQEADEFRRFAIFGKIERAKGLIAQYRDGIDRYRKDLDIYYQLLGRIGERLGEPAPEEPR